MEDHNTFIKAALEQAKASYREGGVPVGAVMVEAQTVIGRGYNRRVQDCNPVSYGETDCMKNVGRRPSVQFGIPKVVIGETENFGGNEAFLRSHGVEVVVLNDPECINLMRQFIEEKPELWLEDIAGKSEL